MGLETDGRRSSSGPNRRAAARRDIVVIGASAGGVEALVTLIQGLPADFPAAIFIVLHTSPHSSSKLPQILARRTSLSVSHASGGEGVEQGHIYVAPPDRHMELRDSRIELNYGPRENHTRPAIDPLFRSAAGAYGNRVVGVILSGMLGDGVAGLETIKEQGGLVVVQDPDEALINDMPRRAVAAVAVDHVVKISEMAGLLSRLVREPLTQKGVPSVDANPLGNEEPVVIHDDLEAQAHNQRANAMAAYVCPECGGVMWQMNQGPVFQFQCHTGHIYSPEVLIFQKSEQVEATLWTCVRLLTEKAVLTRQLANRMRENGDEAKAIETDTLAEMDEKTMHLIRDNILMRDPTPIAQGSMLLEKMLDDAKQQAQRKGAGGATG